MFPFIFILYYGSEVCARSLVYPRMEGSMIKEMTALHENNTWELVDLLTWKKLLAASGLYTMKFHPEKTVERLIKGYSQT